ncbi:orotate phosphoribosyltransferase [bacterium]|nr:orotate phosphoribosyltransferase [bacterium]MBU1025536.1 orotate phosphoribosyltransferase [bacterium]
MKDKLVEMIKAKALLRGEFTLASGKKSNFYLDLRRLTLDSMGASLIGEMIYKHLEDIDYDCIGGPAVGAVPIIGAVLNYAGSNNIDLKGFFVRKEAKSHGTQKLVDGPVEPGNRVVLVEDTTTTAGSLIKCCDAARDFGLVIVKVLVIIDRMEGARENMKNAGYEYDSLVTVEDLGLK